MSSVALRSTLSALLAATLVVGCNAILGNEAGTLAEDDAGGDASPTPGDAGATVDAAQGCGNGEIACFDVCVARNDPAAGCGSCTACSLPHVETNTCAANGQQYACSFNQCSAGFGDCNANKADGCETDLSKPETCGACNARCAGATPLCAPSGTTFACTSQCPTGTTPCGNQCANLSTSQDNCGVCGKACGPNQVCQGATCVSTCPVNTHTCPGNTSCISNTDPRACVYQQSCVDCTARVQSNKSTVSVTCCAGAACTDACTLACKQGRYDCNKDWTDGCESSKRCDGG